MIGCTDSTVAPGTEMAAVIIEVVQEPRSACIDGRSSRPSKWTNVAMMMVQRHRGRK